MALDTLNGAEWPPTSGARLKVCILPCYHRPLEVHAPRSQQSLYTPWATNALFALAPCNMCFLLFA